MSFDRCLSLLSLQDKLPVLDIRDVAQQYKASEGITYAQALERAVMDHLEHARAEESHILSTVSDQYAARTGQKAAPQQSAGERMRARVQGENPFLAFLGEHGVHVDERSDTGGERNKPPMVPGYGAMYRKSGARLDELAQRAHEAGFLSDHDVSNPADNGGTRKLADMIERAAHRKEVIQHADDAHAATPDTDAELMAEAQKLGIETAGKSADQVYDEVVAAHADSFTDHDAQLAADMARDADIPLDGGKPFDHLSDEDIDAIFGIRAANDTAASGGKTESDSAAPARTGAGEAGAAGEGESRAGEGVGERKDDPYTRDLFGGQDLFDDIAVRPGTLDAQKQTARAAISDLARRLGIDRINRRDHPGGSKVSVLGSRLLANFIAGKPNQLVGQHAKTPADLAVLAQVYRDPRFETFRVFYTDRAGKIVGEAGYTSRLAASVTMPGDLLQQVHDDKGRFGASGYYLLHNHPSGHSDPSKADIHLTRLVDKHIPGFQGHVVIDHNEYSVIHNWGEETIKAPHLNGKDFTGMPEMEHAMLGVRITSPDAVARAAKALQVPDGHATLILTTAPGETQLLVDVPMAALAKGTTGDGITRVKALVRRMTRTAGAGGNRFIVLPAGADIQAPAFVKLLAHGVVTDVVNADGQSLQGNGFYHGGDFIGKTKAKSIRVAEPADEYNDRKGERRTELRGVNDRRTIEVDGVRHPIRDTQGRLIGGGDFMKQMDFWRNYKGEVDAQGHPDLPDDTDLATHEPSAGYAPEEPEVPEPMRARLSKLIMRPVGQLRSAAHDVVSLANPMVVGADQAKAIAKDFANTMRVATSQWNAFDAVLRKNYNEAQLRKMWTAADQENDLRREGKTATDKGLNSLPADQRETVELLHAYGEQLWDRAKKAGLVDPDSEGVAFWTPRVAANIYADGSVDSIRPQAGEFSKEAKNLKTSASSTKQRKYETTEESEAALKAKLGEDAAYVKNIRVMPMAMAQLEKAIAGRTLVNQIKAHGQSVGAELISETGGPNFVTFDHPALKRWMPKTDWQPVDDAKIAERGLDVRADGVYTADGDKLKTYRVKNGEAQQLRPMLDSEGKPVLLPSPLFVHKDFAGPLRAVFTSSLGNETADRVYRGMMAMKGLSMSMIMISPMTHNAVIWGKAMPSLISSMGWKNNLKNAATLGGYTYEMGRQWRKDHALFTDLVKGGLVPIGGRGMNPDATAIAEGLKPGRSLAAKALGAVLDPISQKAGDAARKGVDALGHFWHETLLWDRIGDMQVGMAVQMRNHFMDGGMDQYTATRIATHFANRYAGAIPQEAMSQGAHAFMNMMLFSKSFTMTNLGAMKDPFVGLPGDVRAQIREHFAALNRTMGKTDIEAMDTAGKVLKQAQAATRKKAGMILMADFGAMAIVTTLMQAWLKGQDGDDFKKDLIARAHALGAKLDKENPLAFMGPTWGKAGLPLAALRHPFDNLDMLSQTHDNPHGKQDRIRVGEDEHGNSYYMRLPVGKVVEEMKSYLNLSSATDLIGNKASPLAKGIYEIAAKKDFYGRATYDKNANIFVQGAQVAGHLLGAQAPLDDFTALKNLMSGNEHKGGKMHFAGHDFDMDEAKLLGTATGLSVSKLTGGDAVAEMRYAAREQQDKLNNVMPDVKDAVMRGDMEKAQKMLLDAGQTPKEVGRTLLTIQAPNRITAQRIHKFLDHASPDEVERMQKMMQSK